MKTTLMEASYTILDYADGDLLPIQTKPGGMSVEKWVSRGGWLSGVGKAFEGMRFVRIDRAFFLKGAPVILFATVNEPSGQTIKELFRRAWSLSQPSLLFIQLPAELCVYSLYETPEVHGATWNSPKPIEIVRSVADIQDQLKFCTRENIESGLFFKSKRFQATDGRADWRFMEDLKTVRSELMKLGLGGRNIRYAHTLIARSIFIRHLEDRGILTAEYYRALVSRHHNSTWGSILDRRDPSDVISSVSESLFLKALQEKEFTYALFHQLSIDFNGDMFPHDELEIHIVKEVHLQCLRKLLIGDVGQQLRLFLWAYKFDVIPVELISNIYEEFFHSENAAQTSRVQVKDNSTHYTPASLVDFVLSHTLTVERLRQDPRVLDPACGSGIFLVESFKRIVRYHIASHPETRVNQKFLKRIIARQIAGMDVNGDALRIAALSLNLAYLGFLDPPDILEQRKLPVLIVKRNQMKADVEYLDVLVDMDAFSIQEQSGVDARWGDGEFDIVVGNPPWGASSNKTMRVWLEKHGLPVGDQEQSQGFAWRSLEFLRNNGCAGLLVSAGVLFKRHPKSRLFRRTFLASVRLQQVVNFSHARTVFFRMSSAPFVFLEFEKREPNAEESTDGVVQYWTAKRTIATQVGPSILMNKADVHLVTQQDLKDDDALWKVYFWGGHEDRSILQYLRTFPSLEAEAKKRKETYGQGFTEGKKKPNTELEQFAYLPVKNFESYGPLGKDWSPLPVTVNSVSNIELYVGWRLLIRKQIWRKENKIRVRARMENTPFCFNKSLNCITMNNFTEDERKVVLGIMWSSFATYYYFMMSSSWGIWHFELGLSEVLNIPICFPKEDALMRRIGDAVDSLRHLDDFPAYGWDYEVTRLEHELDDAVFELFELQERERERIVEMCTDGFDLLYKREQSAVLQPVDLKSRFMELYLQTFVDAWHPVLASHRLQLRGRIIAASHGLSVIAVIFTIQGQNDDESDVSPPTPEDEWGFVLARLEQGLRSSYNSHHVFVDGMVRVMTDTDIIIVKRNEKRLWTKSVAREDAQATVLQLIHAQQNKAGQ